jgi:hypothetical protein
MQDYTIDQLIKLLKTTKGKAFTTMAGTDILVEIVKADILHTLANMAKHGSTCGWSARVTDWGIHIECNNY